MFYHYGAPRARAAPMHLQRLVTRGAIATSCCAFYWSKLWAFGFLLLDTGRRRARHRRRCRGWRRLSRQRSRQGSQARQRSPEAG